MRVSARVTELHTTPAPFSDSIVVLHSSYLTTREPHPVDNPLATASAHTHLAAECRTAIDGGVW